MFIFGKDKKKKKPEKAPVWFMWLMGAFIVYALLTNIFSDQVSKVQDDKTELTEGQTINFAVVKGLSAGGPPLPLYSRDVERGSGDMVGCWYTVDVRYRLYNGEGEKIEEISPNQPPLEFTIGKGEVIPGLERGVLGMRKNGERVITARPELAFDQRKFKHPVLQKHDFVGYVLTLENMQRPQNLPRSDLGLRIYDDKEGDGLPVQCTDRARIRLHAYNVDGTELFGPKDFASFMLHVGEGKVPYAVERAVMGMKLGGKRTVIAPPGYMRPLNAPVEQASDKTETIADSGEKKTEGTSAEETEKTAEIHQAEADAVAAEQTAEQSKQPADQIEEEQEKTAWQRLPVPQDSTIILEIELLSPYVAMPTKQ